VKQLIYLGTKSTNQNFIQKEIKSRLKSGNACYYSGADSFVFQFLIENLKIKIYRNIILPVVFYGCETWSLTLREERRLRVFEKRVLRRLFGPKTDDVTGSAEIYVTSSLIICILAQYFSGDKIEGFEIGGACSTYEGEEGWIKSFGWET
jgi:hypothetical protein